jgi:hypothetical protein
MRAVRLAPLLLLPALALAPAAGAAPAVTEIADGLDSPRHLAFGSSGDLFVAEAGRGGTGPCFMGGEGPACMGASGAVTRISKKGKQSRIATGLASYANTPTNENAIGPHGITVLGARQVYITNGGPTNPSDPNGTTILRETLAQANPVADLFGRLLRVKVNGKIRNVADIWDFERDVNPDKTVGNPAIDSNPVDVLHRKGRFVVADAGGNALDVVKRKGKVSNLALFPNRPAPGSLIDMQAVPTSVVLGPDGSYYVSQLTGVPFPVHGANIYKVDPKTGAVSIFASGFTNLMDLAFGKDGTLYALEIDHDSLLGGTNEGGLHAVDASGNATQIELPAGSLPMPGGITFRKKALYVTVNSGSPGEGAVVRITGF